jgi:hypothetical protein
MARLFLIDKNTTTRKVICDVNPFQHAIRDVGHTADNLEDRGMMSGHYACDVMVATTGKYLIIIFLLIVFTGLLLTGVSRETVDVNSRHIRVRVPWRGLMSPA